MKPIWITRDAYSIYDHLRLYADVPSEDAPYNRIDEIDIQSIKAGDSVMYVPLTADLIAHVLQSEYTIDEDLPDIKTQEQYYGLLLRRVKDMILDALK